MSNERNAVSCTDDPATQQREDDTMNLDAHAYRINTPRIIHETLDQETVIIDTETGVYFVAGGSGPTLWAALEHGASAQVLAEQLAQPTGAQPASLLPAVERFLAELSAEQLIVATAESTLSPTAFDGATTFVPPTLQKFTDMENLLLIDPIHEVGDAGWPHPKPAAS